MDSVPLPDPRVTVDGRPVACTTRLTYGGAYQLTIWSILPELALELHSSYLGHPQDDTAIAHLHMRPAEQPSTTTEQRPGTSMPVREARRLCLYDHLAALRDLLAEHTSKPVTVDVGNEALELVDVA